MESREGTGGQIRSLSDGQEPLLPQCLGARMKVETMKTFSKHIRYQRSLLRIFGVTAIVMIGATNSFDRPGVRAAMRLPEDVISLQPSLAPSNARSVAPESAPAHELPAAQDGVRRIIPVAPKAAADRPRRQSANRRRALAELMGLVSAPGTERGYVLPFENFQSCREFVAVNC